MGWSEPGRGYRAPSATVETLHRRAELVRMTRRFFEERGVLEVETPLLAPGLIVETHIDPVECAYRPHGALSSREQAKRCYLQPSPEAPMKRLLVEGSGPIFQFSHSFRDGELGRLHQPEFTMLEWYRPGFDHLALMEEVGALACLLFGAERFEKRSYRQVFMDHAGIDPFETPTAELPRIAERLDVPAPIGLDDGNRNGWLDLLLSTIVEPELGRDVPEFVFDYPPTQAALAKIGGTTEPVAERFELYFRGVELSNGYHELLDAREHRLRFEDANVRRAGAGRGRLPVDSAFLAALDRGLPSCAGVAMGFDRVVMVALGKETIDEVVAFAFDPGDARGV